MKKKKAKSEKFSNEDLIKRTQEVEDEKAEKKRIRLEKKEARELKKKREQNEKLVAPVLLMITVLIAFIVSFLSKK
jgi:hypothetical protein